MYPSPLPSPGDLGNVDTSQLVQVLQQVGLSELLQRAHGDWMLHLDWQGTCHAADAAWHLTVHVAVHGGCRRDR